MPNDTANASDSGATPGDAASRRRVTWAFLGVAALVALAGFLGLGWWRASARISKVLEPYGSVAIVGEPAWSEQAGSRAHPVTASPALAAALASGSAAKVRNAMGSAGVDALALAAPTKVDASTPGGVAGGARSVVDRLRAGAYTPPLRGAHFDPEIAVYTGESAGEGFEVQGATLGAVARAILGGAEPPRNEAFPESLRRFGNVEVCVVIKHGNDARLWRSARGSSVARALVLATSAARDRWREREKAMGGPLATLLPRLTVEVLLFEDDGTLASADPTFLDAVVTKEHGIAYTRKNGWRYTMPNAIRRDGPEAVRKALDKLLTDDGLSDAALRSGELRLYRFAVRTLSVSAPERLSDLPSLTAPEAAPSVAPADAGAAPVR